jgi:hypothetical protein
MYSMEDFPSQFRMLFRPPSSSHKILEGFRKIIFLDEKNRSKGCKLTSGRVVDCDRKSSNIYLGLGHPTPKIWGHPEDCPQTVLRMSGPRFFGSQTSKTFKRFGS